MSLQNLILKKDAHALQRNHIQLLTAVNNEAKPRRSTRANILEKESGKVFRYEHLQEKRLKH
jgi:hypothetical protein